MCATIGGTRSSQGGNLMSTNGGTRSSQGGLVSANGAMRSSNIERKKEVVQFYDFWYCNSKKIWSIRFYDIEFWTPQRAWHKIIVLDYDSGEFLQERPC